VDLSTGAADQSATDDGGVGQRQPALDHQPAPLGAPAQLAVLVAPGMGALDHPPATRLDRCWDAPRGDLARHAAFGQDLPARLVVIAGVQMHHGTLGQRADHGDGVQGRGQQPVVAVVGWGGHRGQRYAIGLDGDRALEALLAAVDRAGPGGLAAAGRLGGTARRPGPRGVPGPTMTRQARDLPMTAGCESPQIITARACLVLASAWRSPICGDHMRSRVGDMLRKVAWTDAAAPADSRTVKEP
jgi:hypothetical protein